jgi:transcriptional regulator
MHFSLTTRLTAKLEITIDNGEDAKFLRDLLIEADKKRELSDQFDSLKFELEMLCREHFE